MGSLKHLCHAIWPDSHLSCIKLGHAFFDVHFLVCAMSIRASDSVPFVVRGALVALVACLHVAGVAALSRLPGAPVLQHDGVPPVLRASWIEGASPASPLSPSPPMEVAEPPPVVHPAPPPVPVPVRPNHQSVSVSVPSQPQPVVVDSVPDVPVASGGGMLNQEFDVTASVAASAGAGGIADGEGEGRPGENYVGPSFNVSYFSNPEPEYPSLSRRLREQGLVRLRVHVTVEGRVSEVTLHTSSGFERLDKAALEAVKRWRFRPAQRAGTPVAGWVVVPVRFELRS
jgi:protein TonB